MTSRPKANSTSNAISADHMLRAFVDANVLISFLLRPSASTPPSVIVRVGLRGAYSLLVSETVVTEIRSKVLSKSYLTERITLDNVEILGRVLVKAATIVPEISEPFPEIGPDRKDDYLFAHA